MDRLKRMVAGRPTTTTFLVGEVLAHELGHVLQGVARHSETSVLKERWSEPEIRDMPWRLLHFTPYDVQLILRGVCRTSRNPVLRDSKSACLRQSFEHSSCVESASAGVGLPERNER